MKNRILPSWGTGSAVLCLLLLLPALFHLLPHIGAVFGLGMPPWLLSLISILISTAVLSVVLLRLSKLGLYGILSLGFILGLLLCLTAEGSSGPLYGSGFSLSYFLIFGLSGALAARAMGLVLRWASSEVDEEAEEETDFDPSPEQIEEAYENKISPREKEFRRRLHAEGYRYNLHGKFQKIRLPGLPTLVLPRYHSVIFVRKCQKHGHVGCREFNINELTSSARNKVYQIKANDDNDFRILRGKGWKVIEVWECKLREESFSTTFNQVTRQLDIALQRRGSAT